MTTPSLPLFSSGALLHGGGFYDVWRCGDVVGIRIEGELNDERNPIWRAWLDDRFAKDGYPRFIALDVRAAIPAASLPRRLQTANWGRKTLSLIEYGSVHLGDSATVSLSVRATLRIAGMSNVVLRSNDEDFDGDVAAMLLGQAPKV
jgi:hypothetical protein